MGEKLAHDSVVECKNISIALQPLVVDFGTERFPYTDEQLQIIDDSFKNYGSKIIHDKTYTVYRGSMDMIDTVNKSKQIVSIPLLLLTIRTTGKVGIVGQA